MAVLEDLDFRLESRRCREFLNYACIKKTDASNLGEYVIDIYIYIEKFRIRLLQYTQRGLFKTFMKCRIFFSF